MVAVQHGATIGVSTGFGTESCTDCTSWKWMELDSGQPHWRSYMKALLCVHYVTVFGSRQQLQCDDFIWQLYESIFLPWAADQWLIVELQDETYHKIFAPVSWLSSHWISEELRSYNFIWTNITGVESKQEYSLIATLNNIDFFWEIQPTYKPLSTLLISL